MHRSLPGLGLVGAAVLLSPPLASGLSAGNLGAQVTLATDYVFRGVSQTLEDPAIQGGFDFRHDSGFFAGVWASNVDFPSNTQRENRRDLELDTYLGYRRELADDWTGYATLVRYSYPGSDAQFDYDYTELSLALQFRDRLSGSATYTDDALGFGKAAFAFELVAQFPLPGRMNLVSGIGRFDLQDLGESYIYWNLGVARSWRRFSVDLGYYDTDGVGERICGKRAEPRRVLSLSARIDRAE